MKQYKEIIYEVEYHVIEYSKEDGINTYILNEIIYATSKYKYLKVIDNTEDSPIVNYYLDGMRHYDSGPSKIIGDKMEYYLFNKKLDKDSKEYKALNRTTLINKMLNEESKDG